MNLELVAAIITVASLLVAVIYTPGNFDIWDLIIACLVFYVAYAFRKEFQRDGRAFMISRVGMSLATTIVILTLITIFSPGLSAQIEGFKINILDGEFLITLAVFLLSFFVYRRNI